MTHDEQKHIDSISGDAFFDVCEQLWRNENCPVLPDMVECIQDEYNNAAIDELIQQGYVSGAIKEDEEDDD